MSGGSSEKTVRSPEEKRRLLAALLKKKAAKPKTYPASFSQRRFWFLDQLEPANPVYNIPLPLPLRGEYDPEVTRRAINAIVERHGVLRTVFRVEGDDPVQVVLPSLELEVPFFDLAEMEEEERMARLRRLMRANASEPFDLAEGPLFRASLVRALPGEYVLLLCTHHIVGDGWSNGIIHREFLALHDAFSRGLPSPLPELPIQYGDFAAWQQKQISGEALDRQLDYWRDKLTGVPEVLDLPSDRPRPPVQDYAGKSLSHLYPSYMLDALNALSREEGATLFMTLLAAFKHLLYRYSGEEQVVVGTPIAGRLRPELEGLVGFFVNTLVLHTDVSGDPTFRELVRRVKETTLGAYAHQEMPFDLLVDELEVDRSLAHAPLFQVLFTLQSVLQGAAGADVSEEDNTGGSASMIGILGEQQHSMFDLSFNAHEGPQGLGVTVEFRRDLWDSDSMGLLIMHLGNLLEKVAENPDVPLSTFTFHTREERFALVRKFNDTAAEHGADVTLAARIESQAARTPNAVAVEHAGERRTYAELNARANRIARRLRELGVGPESRVGVALPRGLDLPAAVVAVLKAGGCYVALDPAYPAERLEYMLADAGAAVLVTTSSVAGSLPSSDAHVLALDAESDALDALPSDDLGLDVAADHPAYVLYTSGSTGRPKGVVLPRRALRNLVDWQLARWTEEGEPKAARTLQFASLSFDVSAQEILCTLSAGGTLVGVDEETRRDAERMLRHLADASVERVFLPFAALQALAEAADDAPSDVLDRLALREIVTAGEQLQNTPALRSLAERTGARVENQYGPSETHVVTAHRLAAKTGEWPLLPPIGQPIANTRAYVLDERMQPSPAGIPGEVYLAGENLARGYLDRPGMTAEKFVPDPFSQTPGARLYRTGDRGRWLRNGVLEFAGRADDQVKVRGYRIEPGEVESVLRQADGVADAVVVAREVEGRTQLVGYVVPADVGAASSEADASSDATPGDALRTIELDAIPLREHLKSRLPEYMVPSAFVGMRAFPLTPSGKVDRRALPAPDAVASAAGEHVAPRTEMERTLAAIWGEVLGLERVGVSENFFDLGGHSLLATRVASRMRRALEREVPVRMLFEAPTVGELAARLAAQGTAADTAPPLVAVDRDRPLPLSFAQERLWFVDRLVPDSPAYNLPLVLPVGGADAEIVARALGEIVRRHEALRTTFRADGEDVVQVIHPAPESFDLPVVDFSDRPEDERGAALGARIGEETGRPFDLEAGPLFRGVMLRASEEEQVLVLAMHHAVSDGWSMDVLTRELDALYKAFAEERPSPLAELPVQYADYAVWQREWLSGDELERQIGYWRTQLAGAPALLELPADRPRPAVQSYAGAVQGFAVPAATAEALRGLARGEGATLFMVLLAAFDVLLSRWSGQDDVVVGSPIAGRNRAETEELIGFFVNNLVMRTDLSGDPSFRELVARVKDVTLGAYAHQDLPFEKLVEELNVERSLSHPPLFQVLFNLLNTAPAGVGGEAGALPDGTTEPEARPAKFDLTFEVHEAGEALWVAVEYATDLFDHETITRMAAQFRALLAAVVSAPESSLSAFDLTEDAERRLLLTERAGRTTAYPRDESITSLFRAQAAKTPDATAVEFGGETLTYRQLDGRANRLARHLRASGVRHGDRVGIAVERGAELVVAVLATLEAGAAYVPLDASYPAERLRFMADDADVSVLVVADRAPEALSGVDVPLVSLSAAAAEIEAQPAEPLALPLSPDSLAYVVYTSGSTGQPKGVAVPHRAVVRLVKETDFISFSADETFLQLAPVAFDASTLELWGPLLNGGRLVVFPPETPSLEDLGRFLVDREVTTLWLTAGLFHQMVDAQLDAFAGVRQLLAGGDVLSPSHVKRVLDAHPELTLVNGYGPTESTTFTTTRRITRDDVERATVPIGEPIANTYVRILDDAMRPVPVGVPGELYVGGDGLAWGYVDRPALTAERFVPDPYAETEGARLYATGDRVRWLADGAVEFLGRTDQQVKVRGYRIEPGEIETALTVHPTIREAVVVARTATTGDRRLVGYVVPAEGTSVDSVDADALRAHLRGLLPAYMVPGAFVALEALPLTPNGKLDRRALPAPEPSAGEAEFVAPRTETERLLAEMWGDILGREQVSVEADFFALGGHSLLATRVVSRIRAALDVELPLRAIFEAPTVAGLAARIDQARGTSAAASAPAIVPTDRDRPLPLSFAQERLWFVDRLVPNSPAYNVPLVLPVGDADADTVACALGEIVRRHEALRTTFAPAESGDAVQVIHPAPESFDLPVVDLTDVPEDEREAAVARHAAEEAQTPFDLQRGPLFRARLVRASENEQLLLVTMHHIVSDGWSMGVFTRELTALYGAFAKGEASPLPELPVQYADFSVWQREWLSGDELERQTGYWSEQLAGAPTMLELPTDRPRPPVQTFRGGAEAILLPPAVVETVERVAREAGATPFMVLLAAFDVLLSRWSGQDDVVVGSPIAGRNRAETEPLIGFFVNNLVLRTDLSGDPTFRDLVARVKETTLGAYAHQDLPFEKLVDELEVERDLSHTPLFQVMFALQNTGEAGGGATALPEGVYGDEPVTQAEHATAKFDLAVDLNPVEGGGLLANLEYNADLFDAATAKRMARHLRALVEAAASEPDAAISSLDVLSGDERTTLVEQWNDTSAASPSGPAHVLFAAQVEQTPDAPALVFGGEPVSYADLEARSNRLARHLTTLGVGRDVPVAISLPRSPEMVVALLAAMKAGGAYLPVDPTYPAERRRWMLEDSGAPVVLTLSTLVDDLPTTDAKTVLLDEVDLSSVADDVLSTDVSADDLAYVIYTSGSTGRPKGVAVTHRGIGNLAAAQGDAFGIQPGTRVLQFASFSFDAAVSEVLVTLLNGGVLHLAAQDEMQPGEPLLSTLREGRIEVVTLPPSVLSVMPPEGLDDLRTIVSAGEACPAEVVRTWSADGRRFINAYGPTETTVCATMAVGLTSEDVDGRRVPIGGPIRNVRVYVLDARMRPVPVGVPGELYVGGPNVARGYLNRPELTAEKFVDDPFSADDDARLYRTGDRVRWTAEGTLEFLGRLDEQVKVRGFRIELGEIEAALRSQDGVADAVVLARTDLGAEPTLVGYVVPATNVSTDDVDADALRAALRRTLPEHMVPAAVVALDALPTTPNGKVDRRALPRPDLAGGTEYVAPRTPTEEALAAIWSEVLGVEKVGVRDDFFAAGGHSLAATRLVARVAAALGTEIPVRTVFEAPTVEAMAGRIDAAEGVSASAAPPIVPVERDGPVPLSFAQERLWFVDRLVPNSAAYNVPLVLPVGGADADVVARALGEIVRRHEALRTTFAPGADGDPVQVIGRAPESFDLPVVDLSGLSDAERARQAELHAADEANRPFDLQRGPLLRARLLRLAADEQLLLVTMHHIVSDGWSMGVFTRELTALYDAFAKGAASPLPDLPIQYADYSAWQRAWLSGDELERQIAYWKDELAGAPPHIELPTDRPRPPVQTFAGASHNLMLPKELAAALHAVARDAGATPFMVLLAAWSLLLSRWSGQDDVVVGSPVAGRVRPETEPLIGFFINNLVLRTDLSADPSFRDLVGRVKETTLGAYAHQDLPFEKLVEELGAERSMSHTPLFQVLFNFLTEETSAPSAPPGESEWTSDGEAAKYDLSLTVQETEAGLYAGLNYNVDLFDAATVARMSRHLRALLEQAVASPDRRLSALEILDADERARVEAFGAEGRDYPESEPLHAAFERQAARTPDVTALVHAGDRISYAELDARADRLANHLRTLGVGAESRVGLCLPRTPELVVGMLATLKAGGAYVPLDPNYPAERIRLMLEDSAARVVLAAGATLDALPETEARVVAVDRVDLAGVSSDAPGVAVDVDQLAYCIYTSGSTGRPKAVAITHRSTTPLVHWMRETVSDEERAGVLGSTSVSFDVSIAEIFGTLSWGGTLVLVENALSLAEMRDDDPAILYASMVPSAAAELLRMGAIPSTVRTLGLGGEPLPADLARALHEQTAVERILNLYGPTEDTTYSSSYDVPADVGRMLVGRPVAGAVFRVLDDAFQPVPVGVPGELWISGRGLSRGYLDRPALTAERYVPDPHADEPGARMYRVGDRVRWTEDGVLEYLGRVDQQVKVRGFRIETGEIEAALRAHPSVEEAVVAAPELAPGDVRLVAWVVPADGTSTEDVDVAALRAMLADRLPAYMVPSATVVLDELPRLPNGKVNRRALPAPDLSGAAPGGAEAPRDETEAALVEIWEEVLGVRPGPNDDFFALGGHSLLAVRLMTRIRERLGRELPISALFQGGTVARLAEMLRTAGEAREASPLVPMAEGGGTPFFVVHGAAGVVFRYATLAREIGGRPVYALQPPALESDDEAMPERLDVMAAQYVEAIREVQPEGPYLLGGWSTGGAVAAEMTRQLEEAGETVSVLVLLDAQAPGHETEEPSDAELLVWIAGEMGRPMGDHATAFVEEVASLDEEAMLRRALEWINASGPVLPDDPAPLRRHLRVLRAGMRASAAQPPRPVRAPVALLQAQDRITYEQQLTQTYGVAPNYDYTVAWHPAVRTWADSRVVPGDHYSMLDGENARALAERVRAVLADAETQTER